MEESTVLHGISYVGAGGLALAAAAWFFSAMLRQALNRIKKDGTLDERVLAQMSSIESTYKNQIEITATSYDRLIQMQTETIEALRTRLEKIQDELSAAYTRIADMQMQHHAAMTETVAVVRQENQESTRRLHDRLDRTEINHRECETQLLAQGTEIKVLREIVTKQPSMNITMTPGTAAAQLTAESPAAASA